MKKSYLLPAALLAFAATLYLSAFQSKYHSQSSKATDFIKQAYLKDLAAFAAQLDTLHAAVGALDATETTAEALRQAHRATRQRYKRLEYLVAYLDPEANKKVLNGAPLPSLEPNAPGVFVLEPEGLQVIDELVFSDDVLAAQEELAARVDFLRQEFPKVHASQSRTYLTDRNIFEAVRFQLVRVLSLGLTGYDTPGSLNALPEATASFESLSRAVAAYYPTLSAQDPVLRQHLEETFVDALAYLNAHQDFDTFDRLHFLRKFVNPLFKGVLDAQRALGVENRYEVVPQGRKFSTNFLAENIFDPDFLDASFYVRSSPTDYTPEAVALGEALFFDPVLSVNNERACASCHHPAKAFTDGQRKSIALNFEGTVARNAPTLINAVYAGRFFYDLRVEKLEDQFQHVVTSDKEFHTDYFTIAEKLQRSDEYRALFDAAFPRQGIRPNSVSTALGAFVHSLQAFNSPFDRYVRHETDSLPLAARRGFNLFMGKAACGTCHFAPTFNGAVPPIYEEMESEVLGVAATKAHQLLDSDPGRAAGQMLERSEIYANSFKTVTVRNVALTAPYMHNGVYDSLAEVINFYNQGGGQGLGLDVPNQTLAPDPLNLTEQEQQDLIAFMEALTDTSGLNRVPARLPAFNDPSLEARVIGGKY